MRILVLQHADVEHPGVFRDFWSEAGHTWLPIELDAGEPIPALDGFNVMVAMGGPMDVWQEDLHPWLALEKAAIREWVVERGLPYMGICLGHQLLGEALGGKVGLMAKPEVGLSMIELTPTGQADPVLSGFPTQVETLQWHGAEITRLPEGAEILATNSACPVQAIRYGRHAYGLQFHCEILSSTVEDWERIPAYRQSLVEALGHEDAANLASTVGPRLPGFRRAAKRLNDNFMALIA